MEYFCSNDKGIIQTTTTDYDPFGNFSDMMDLDGFSKQPTTSLSAVQLLGYSNSYSSYDKIGFLEPNSFVYPVSNVGIPYDSDSHLGSDENETVGNQYSISLLPKEGIPRPVGCPFPERMLRALSLFKGASKGGILAQVWVPIRDGGECVLSTCEQPYLLDELLLGYREVSRKYTFAAEHKPGSFPGLPGRVFMSRIPEWTPDVGYYNSGEYSRINDAREYQVHGSIGIPVFGSGDASCCAVLELVTVKEKPSFNAELELVSQALKAVDLTTTALPRQPLPQHLSPTCGTALAEIADVLRAVCHAHRLPLALTWTPFTPDHSDDLAGIPTKKPLLYIEERACYINDKNVNGFVLACKEHPLSDGQGVAGNALRSNIPSFSTDVKAYHVNDYPLAQHARRFGLNAAVAIRLRSTYTGNNDYVLEFFLPLNMVRTKEQQQLLDSLSGTMQRMCRSLRTVSDAELAGSAGGSCGLLPQTVGPRSVGPTGGLDGSEPVSLEKACVEAGDSSIQTTVSRYESEKKRSTAEKTVSLSVLQQYFSGSLKDAAKSIGVCPTTLKRICRQHGISRWPSRKINKVNRSLKKIRTVLGSVEGVEGHLKFDPTTGGLVTSGSTLLESDPSRRPEIIPTETYSTTTLDKQSVSSVDPNISSHLTLIPQGSEEHRSYEQNSSVESGPTNMEYGNSMITVKATYRDDTARFKFDTSSGYLHLYEEVGSRFKIQSGNFQLKYLDDEDEWVMLASESDLSECVEIMEVTGKRSVKLLVRDVICSVGSSSSSNGFLYGGS